MLNWDETDVLSALEVIPEEGEHGIYHQYTVLKGGLILKLTICQYDGDVFFELFQDGVETPIFKMNLFDCDGVKRQIDEFGEYLQFAPAQCFRGRYDGELSVPYGVRLSIHPHISIKPYCKL